MPHTRVVLNEDSYPQVLGDLVGGFLDHFYLGDHCLKCQLRDVCPDPVV